MEHFFSYKCFEIVIHSVGLFSKVVLRKLLLKVPCYFSRKATRYVTAKTLFIESNVLAMLPIVNIYNTKVNILISLNNSKSQNQFKFDLI